jgi:hypothetical protein
MFVFVRACVRLFVRAGLHLHPTFSPSDSTSTLIMPNTNTNTNTATAVRTESVKNLLLHILVFGALLTIKFLIPLWVVSRVLL